MKKLKHFPTYTIKSSVGIFVASIYTDSGTLFCKVNGDTKQEADTNAKRIVDCVNAMAGIKNPAEWMSAVRKLAGADMVLNKKMFSSIKTLQEENEQLLDGIEMIDEHINRTGQITITKGSTLDTALKLILKNAGKK